jgi:hypothetical protein
MPIKSCVCSVCGLEVPKASTSHVGDGKRACKSHPDTEARAEAARKSLERPAPSGPSWRTGGSGYGSGRPSSFESLIGIEARMRHWADKECWLCNCSGIALGPDYAMLLTAFKRLGWGPEDFATFRPETLEAVRAKAREDLGVLLHLPKLPADPSRRGPILDKVSRNQGADQAVSELGWVQTCEACADRYGLEIVPELRGPDVLTTLGLLLAIRSAHLKALDKDRSGPSTEGEAAP